MASLVGVRSSYKFWILGLLMLGVASCSAVLAVFDTGLMVCPRSYMLFDVPDTYAACLIQYVCINAARPIQCRAPQVYFCPA